MSGNVWEWVLDEYRTNYEGAPSDGHHAVGSLPECEMICENGAARRAIRGGSWNIDADLLRVAYRHVNSPDFRYYNLGLRLRRTLP
jgi:formylglycine-generating enzyme required for sulfatase activity